MGLRARYQVCGTDVAYPVMILGSPYDISGTDVVYGAMAGAQDVPETVLVHHLPRGHSLHP
eukprot:2024889-Rhodomonas_salina.1